MLLLIFKHFSNSGGVWWCLIMILICISLMSWVSSFMPVCNLVSIFCRFFLNWIVFFLILCRNSLYILNMNRLLGLCVRSNFAQAMASLFTVLMFLDEQKSWAFDRSWTEKRGSPMIFSGKNPYYSINVMVKCLNYRYR